MSLPELLAPNFTRSEFETASRGNWPATYDAKVLRVAALLQQIRTACGNRPMVVTSFYREGDPNQHGKAEAVDFEILGVNADKVGRWILAAHARGEIGAYGQLIIYPYTTQHVHFSLPDTGIKAVNRNLVKVANGYAAWGGGNLPPFTAGAVVPSDAAPDPAGEVARASLSLPLVLLLVAVALGRLRT